MISFFRDFLSGPLYIVVVVISVIGIFACIGYLAERSIKEKEEKKKYEEMYARVHLLPVDDATGVQTVSTAQTAFPTAQLGNVGDVSATNVAQNAVLSQVSPEQSGNLQTGAATSVITVEEPAVVLIEESKDTNNLVVKKDESSTATDSVASANHTQ